MSWKSEVVKKGTLFAIIGLAIGFLFGVSPDSKTAMIYGPKYLLIKAIEGLLFGFILGVLFGTSNHLYQKSPGPRPLAGAILCFIVGFLFVGFIGFMFEEDHAWKLRPMSRSSVEMIRFELALRDGLVGGLIGAGLGFLAGFIDQRRLHHSTDLKAQHPNTP